ncbi:MAG: cupin domain-containing protein [Pseudomonadales bacterium]|nr:cupin domain-containing protein [Pseudomonadales bacterium]NRA14623.1 cupin domain-containing protein [Oceanospirillaceae bacterium]
MRDRAKALVQLENERVIVTQWTFAANAETGWHKHGLDYVVVPQTDGQLLLESSEGEKIVDLNQGVSYYRSAGVEHNVVNANDYPFVFVEIELKQ